MIGQNIRIDIRFERRLKHVAIEKRITTFFPKNMVAVFFWDSDHQFVGFAILKNYHARSGRPVEAQIDAYYSLQFINR